MRGGRQSTAHPDRTQNKNLTERRSPRQQSGMQNWAYRRSMRMMKQTTKKKRATKWIGFTLTGDVLSLAGRSR